MIKYLNIFFFTLSTLLYPFQINAQFTTVQKSYSALPNLLSNPGAEQGKTGVTASAGTFTTTTTTANVGSGSAAFGWDASASGQTLTWASVTVPYGLANKTLAISCNIQTPSGTATHEIQLYDGTNIVSEATITSSTSYARTTINGPAGAAGSTIALRIYANANEPQIYIDDCILADAALVNLFFVDTSIAPTIQKFTSGSGTYTLPSSPKPTHIRVRLVGGGGGGAGSTGGGAGGTGGNTTFGTSLLTGNGGAGGTLTGAASGGAGGTGSLSAPAIGTALTGGKGQGALYNGGVGMWPNGGDGAASPFGGAGGGGGFNEGGYSAITNSGSGGGGSGASNGGAYNGGGGGGAGGYVDAIIPSPSTSYSYAVGSGGTAGTAGSSGSTGGTGGSGYIEVTEYYTPTTGIAFLPNQTLDTLGTVFYVAKSTCPSGSVAADGSAVSRTGTYAQLFNRIGTVWGTGDGSTTFNLPNLNGIFIRGAGTQTISSIVHTAAALGTAQNDQMQGHYHNMYQQTNADYTRTGAFQGVENISPTTGTSKGTGSPITDGTNGTPRTGTTTYPANQAMTACISHVSQQAPLLTGTAPTIQKLTSGTNATYTLPTGVKYIKVRMVGGGGGGAGSRASSGGSSGSAGGNTCFGTNATACTSPIFQANGGSGATIATGTGGAGGTATINSPGYGTSLSGAYGGGASLESGGTNTLYAMGGTGGSSPWGGAGPGGGAALAGTAAIANTGSGGGGGGSSLAANAWSGAGGGAGGYIEGYITNPSTTYYYTVGAVGAKGTAGTSGYDGGDGALGYIEVTEYYSY